MSFTYSAIGDNTPENREHLDKIGMKRTCSVVGNLIMVVQGTYTCFELEGKIGNNFQDAINCIGNPALFQAVTAMRDDSDYMQWFHADEFDTWIHWKYKKIPFKANSTCEYHKATLEELINHFNSK